jgi:hypothetical protein
VAPRNDRDKVSRAEPPKTRPAPTVDAPSPWIAGLFFIDDHKARRRKRVTNTGWDPKRSRRDDGLEFSSKPISCADADTIGGKRSEVDAASTRVYSQRVECFARTLGRKLRLRIGRERCCCDHRFKFGCRGTASKWTGNCLTTMHDLLQRRWKYQRSYQTFVIPLLPKAKVARTYL